MKDKLTEMSGEDLVAYREKHAQKQEKYQQGSKNWLKCQRRINRATLMLRTLHN